MQKIDYFIEIIFLIIIIAIIFYSMRVVFRITMIMIAWVKVDAKKALLCLMFFVLLSILIVSFFIRSFNNQTTPYDLWNEMKTKDPKPNNIPQVEYEAKNRKGYCWRDKKYYSKKELWYKAMKSLTGRMFYENRYHALHELPEKDCNSGKTCKVARIPKNSDTDKLFQIRLNTPEFWEKLDTLIKNNQAQSWNHRSIAKFANDDFMLNNYILIHQWNDTSSFSLYDSENCCKVLNKSDWSLVAENYILKEGNNGERVFNQEARIPVDEDINSWGIGNYYFDVTKLVYSTNNLKYNDNTEILEVQKTIFIMNNCGDILYKPYFYFDETSKKNENT